jgi:hypothetical protein
MTRKNNLEMPSISTGYFIERCHEIPPGVP